MGMLAVSLVAGAVLSSGAIGGLQGLQREVIPPTSPIAQGLPYRQKGSTPVGAKVRQAAPVLWLHPDGDVFIGGKPAEYRVLSGTRPMVAGGWTVWDFAGPRSGLLFGDRPELALSGSMTVSTWIYLRAYVTHGPGAQVLFRGDDRGGLDPISLTVHEGTITFAIQNSDNRVAGVASEIPLNRWVHVIGSFDSWHGHFRMWLDGELVSFAKTSVRPFAGLDPAFAPGFSVGNVQNDRGPHNQPLNGLVTDLRLYPAALSAEELGYAKAAGGDPSSRPTGGHSRPFSSGWVAGGLSP